MGVLVGKMAPQFDVDAVVKNKFVKIKLSDFKDTKPVVLFFYPLDFTSVCNTEMHAFQSKLREFESRNVKLLACSTDSQFSHLAWLKAPKAAGGIEGIGYPILADLHKTMARDYDVLSENGFAHRGLFIIDKKGVVRHQSVNEANVGRNVEDVLRTLDAILHVDEHGDFCPANWKGGDSTLTDPVALSSPI